MPPNTATPNRVATTAQPSGSATNCDKSTRVALVRQVELSPNSASTKPPITSADMGE